jgi:hypothetical protein
MLQFCPPFYEWNARALINEFYNHMLPFVQLECACSAGMIALVYLGVPFMQQLLLDEVCLCVYAYI